MTFKDDLNQENFDITYAQWEDKRLTRNDLMATSNNANDKDTGYEHEQRFRRGWMLKSYARPDWEPHAGLEIGNAGWDGQISGQGKAKLNIQDGYHEDNN